MSISPPPITLLQTLLTLTPASLHPKINAIITELAQKQTSTLESEIALWKCGNDVKHRILKGIDHSAYQLSNRIEVYSLLMRWSESRSLGKRRGRLIPAMIAYIFYAISDFDRMAVI